MHAVAHRQRLVGGLRMARSARRRSGTQPMTLQGHTYALRPRVNTDSSARNAVAALTKRLSHRNPNVQLYALELANTLAQNCGKPIHQELSSRTWTGALTRLVNERVSGCVESAC